MVLAGAKIILDFYNNDRLAEKKDRLEDLFKDVRRKYNVSILEVDDFEELERCVIGVSLCAGTQRGAEAALETVLKYIDQNSFARVMSEDPQIIAFD